MFNLKQKLAKTREELEKLNTEVLENKKNHEKEVAMRLKFESKLNHLHSLYRDMETRYERACEDIDKYTVQNKEQMKLNDSQRVAIANLTQLNVKLETDFDFSKSQTKFQMRENEHKAKVIKENETKIKELEAILAEKDENLDLKEKKMKRQEIDLNSKDTIVTGLKYERGRLEEALRDYKAENEKLNKRFEEMKKNFEETRERLQDVQREELHFEEVSKNFDMRVRDMDENNKKLMKDNLQLEKDLETERGKNKILNSQNEQLTSQNSDITAEIQELNKLKNKYKIDFEKVTDELAELNTLLVQKNSTLAKNSKEIERQGRRLAEMEQLNDTLEIEK